MTIPGLGKFHPESGVLSRGVRNFFALILRIKIQDDTVRTTVLFSTTGPGGLELSHVPNNTDDENRTIKGM